MQLTAPKKDDKFVFSYSKLKGFENCPKRYYHISVARDVKEEESEQLRWGNHVHKELAKALQSKARGAKGPLLPTALRDYEKWLDKIVTDSGSSKILVEQKIALNKDFGPCGYWDRDVWYRGIGDVVKITGRVALIVDYKTGRLLDDHAQLALMAACVFAHYPEVQAVRSEFIWLKEDTTTSLIFKRQEMPNIWTSILPRVQTLEHAFVTCTYPPKPSGLCKRYCPVEQCPHHGE